MDDSEEILQLEWQKKYNTTMTPNLKMFWGKYFYWCVMDSKWSTTLLLLISILEVGSLTAQKLFSGWIGRW